jgi:hypothetical protein
VPTALPTNWWNLDDEPRIRDAYTAELRKECGPSHVLAGRRFQCLGKCEGCDSAVFALDHGEWAIVHLAWAGREADPQWPTVEALGTWADVLEAMAEHSRTHD